MRKTMARASIKLAFLMVVTLFLGACTATPPLDTTNKQVYATELAVEGMLAQVDQYQQEGRFTDEQWARVQTQLVRLQTAYEAMEFSQAIGEDPTLDIATIHDILLVLRKQMEDE